MSEYAHVALNKEIASLAGHYTLQKEVRLRYKNREVLYILGHAAIESSCCGISNYEYVIVPGYIISWRNEKNDYGVLTSEVERISDGATKKELNRIISKRENTANIEFL